MTLTSAHVPLPELVFRDETPVSSLYDDVYFSRAGGVAETRHVFLHGNHLPERFAQTSRFTIAELGFGTGLNFLVTWQAFLQAAPADHHLHYVAIEKFPLTAEMLANALGLQPELAALTAQLLAALPLRLPGFHRVHLPRVTLTLGYGDVADLLPQLTTPIDAWFLDGFSPAKNPHMWSEEVLAQIGRLSAAEASFATFTAAGFVKRGLQAQGFTVEKIPGYGHKREMLVGRKHSLPSRGEVRVGPGRSEDGSSNSGPLLTSPLQGEGLSALVLGGGIAGCTLARALAERGVHVTLLERTEIASGASGNAGAVLFPQLTKRWGISAAWYFAAYDFMLQQLARWKSQGLPFTSERCGMLRLPRHAQEEAQLQLVNQTLGLDPSIVQWVDTEMASNLSGVTLATGGAWFPQGTWLAPAELCRTLVQHPNIAVHENAAVIACERAGKHWSVKTENRAIYTAEHCCITTSHDAAAFFPEFGMRLHAVGGQVSVVKAPISPRSILCHKGYVIPVGEQLLIGATYNHDGDALAVTAENHAENIAAAADILPAMAVALIIGGRSSLRATTPDRLPYVGQLAGGLFVSAGHGSRGMLSAPLAAEVIASQIMGEQIPITEDLRQAVNPLRFNA